MAIVSHPKDIYVRKGESYTITSTFNQPVFCSWIQIHEPWITVRNNTIKSTGNCTLTIENAQLRDAGSWTVVGFQQTGRGDHKISFPVDVFVLYEELCEYVIICRNFMFMVQNRY